MSALRFRLLPILIYLIGFLPICLGINGCKSKQIAIPSYQIVMLSIKDDLIKIRTYGQGENAIDAAFDADKRAFNTLLLNGFTSPKSVLPLLANPANSNDNYTLFLDNFYKKGDYKNYITIYELNDNKKVKSNLFYVSSTLEINLRALRTHLETNNVIRRFGY